MEPLLKMKNADPSRSAITPDGQID